jgi:DNA-binding NtrC family response regulator
MRNILVITDKSKETATLVKSLKSAVNKLRMKQRNISISTDSVNPLKYDIALLDLDIGNWQKKLFELRRYMPVIAFASPDVKKAVEAIKLGASDFLEKPLGIEILNEIINKHKKKILTHDSGFDETMGTSLSMQSVYGLIKKAAASESNVLITGESGTGKELVARSIH